MNLLRRILLAQDWEIAEMSSEEISFEPLAHGPGMQ